MDRLWSPWRYRYVSHANPDATCIFCSKPLGGDEAGLVLYRGVHNFVLLNLYPYTNGHLMVAPYEHVADLERLSGEAAIEMMALTQQAVGHLKAVYRPQTTVGETRVLPEELSETWKKLRAAFAGR